MGVPGGSAVVQRVSPAPRFCGIAAGSGPPVCSEKLPARLLNRLLSLAWGFGNFYLFIYFSRCKVVGVHLQEEGGWVLAARR